MTFCKDNIWYECHVFSRSRHSVLFLLYWLNIEIIDILRNQLIKIMRLKPDKARKFLIV